MSPEITALLHANGAIEANDSDKKICTIGELLAELKYGEADKLYFELKKRSDYHYIYNDVDLLFCSLQYGNFSLAKRIINNGVECNSYDDSLYSAILAKYGIKSASDIREMIKFLCHNGFSLINKHQGIKRNENILHTSLFCMSFAREAEILDNLSFEEYTTFLDMLQDAGANFTQNYLYLQAAIEGLNTPLMHYCVNSGMTFDKLDKKINGSIISIFTDFVIFDEKSEDAYLHLLDFALSHGADINYQDSCGNTVLHHLAYSKSANSKDNILRALIKYGADKHIKNNRGLTPFSCACESGRPNAECTILRD